MTGRSRGIAFDARRCINQDLWNDPKRSENQRLERSVDLFHNQGMDRDVIIERLKSAEVALRARGVDHAALFGSVARGEAGPDSDIDILVDLNPDVVRTMFDYAGVKGYIAEMFDGAVDVVDREGLKPHVRPSAISDAVYAF